MSTPIPPGQARRDIATIVFLFLLGLTIFLAIREGSGWWWLSGYVWGLVSALAFILTLRVRFTIRYASEDPTDGSEGARE